MPDLYFTGSYEPLLSAMVKNRTVCLEGINFTFFYFFFSCNHETEVIKTEFMWMNTNRTSQPSTSDYSSYCSLLNWKSSWCYLMLLSKCCLGMGREEEVWAVLPAHFIGIANTALLSLLTVCTPKGFTWHLQAEAAQLCTIIPWPSHSILYERSNGTTYCNNHKST